MVADTLIDDGECQFSFLEQPILFIDLFKPHFVLTLESNGWMALHS